MNSGHLFLLAAFSVATPAFSAELVSNGSFETQDFTGWTQFEDTSLTFVTPSVLGGGPTDGDYHAAFGPQEIGGISQTLATVPGQTYRITFDLANLQSDNNVFTAGWNDGLLTFTFNDNAFDYLSLEVFAVAESDSSELIFRFRHSGNYFLLDNVSVQAMNVIPEPASWVMLIAGFGAVGVMARRRGRAIGPVRG